VIDISYLEYLTKFLGIVKRLCSEKEKRRIRVYQLIRDWFNYIDCNLESKQINMSRVDHMEREIDDYFIFKKSKNLNLKMGRRFRRRFLKAMGIRKELIDDIDLFKKYARLDLRNTPGLMLYEKAKGKTKLESFPYEFYWWIIKGNFLKFYSRYRSGNIDIEEVTWADIEMPLKVLRLMFEFKTQILD
jgi:hypothetical protein